MAYRNNGLWLSGLRVEVQKVTHAHRKVCDSCEDDPKGHRLVMSQGSGRSQMCAVLCEVCGAACVELLCDEGRQLVDELRMGLSGKPIRKPPKDRENRGWPFDKIARARAKKAKERKERKREELLHGD